MKTALFLEKSDSAIFFLVQVREREHKREKVVCLSLAIIDFVVITSLNVDIGSYLH